MPHIHHLLRAAGFGLAALCAGAAVPASAFQNNDHVYADSFGNLVVDSAAGYKRIVVGQGHMARHMAANTTTGEPRVVYLNGAEQDAAWSDCYRPPVFVKGRSYMYGLAEGEMPELSPCR
ncbi:hypothetical protein MIC97_09705 [Aquamicrobium sp. NLF2-7]|jgi:hypothetical protein|uniref:hypothetical protein n=1 Tax=Aquamicrobium sp. NLF2-7 TaxID=2918753 RepID=UPI001EFB54BA|nr:hypothetical protein [Aquamicrobium sp. NLF2-7]MCG8271777.1 hypothetical protein [Aquamicrobium sp. NLF2-7]